MDECCGSQPSYLRLLLDEEDPEEIWDTCFTNSQLVQCVPSPVDYQVQWDDTRNVQILGTENCDSEALWMDEFSNVELNEAMDNFERGLLDNEPCFDLNCPIVISSDEDEHVLPIKLKNSCAPLKDFSSNDHDDFPPTPRPLKTVSRPTSTKEKKSKPVRTFKPPVSPEEAERMKYKMFTPKTKRKINWALTMYSQWHALRDIDSPHLENLDKASVQQALCAFILKYANWMVLIFHQRACMK